MAEGGIDSHDLGLLARRNLKGTVIYGIVVNYGYLSNNDFTVVIYQNNHPKNSGKQQAVMLIIGLGLALRPTDDGLGLGLGL